MDNKDEIIAKLKRENAYLKSLLEQNGISYGEPKEIKSILSKQLPIMTQ